MPEPANEPPSISVEDAARRVVAIFLQAPTNREMSDRLMFALGMLAGALDRGRDGTMESDAT